MGTVGTSLLSPDLRHGHEGGAHPAHPDEHGGGLGDRLLRRGVGRVQAWTAGLLYFLARRSGMLNVIRAILIQTLM